MSKINIGKSEKKNVEFDLDVLLRTRLLIQASSGQGKSWLLRVLAEQAFGKVQIIIIDVEGEFPNLREKYDFVLVGKGGEAPADTRSAALLAHKLLELNASAICDLYEMKASDRHRWVRLFLEALIDAPKNLWHPVLVIVDEAHVFCPEKGAGESEASDAMIGLATRGRKRGFCAVFATQRLGKLRKDAAAEMLNVMIGGTFIDVDRKRAADALGIPNNELHAFFDEMKVIKPGMFWVLGRAISKERILCEVGKVETKHPESGSSKYSAEPPPAPDKIKLLLPKLSDLPKEAEAKARTEADLRKEVAELKRQLSTRPTLTVPEVKIERVEVPVFQSGELDRLEAIARNIGDYGAQLVTVSRDISTTAKSARNAPRPTFSAPAPRKPVGAISTPRPPAQSVIPAESNGSLPVGEQKVLTVCGQYPDGVLREQITIITGYKRSTRDEYIKRLQQKGLVNVQGKAIFITDAGFDSLGLDFEPLPTGDELREYWLNRLPSGERKILEVLCSWYPSDVDRDLISEQTNYARSSRDEYIKRLSARKLVMSTGPARVKVSDSLFG
jgi:hypothetical protein